MEAAIYRKIQTTSRNGNAKHAPQTLINHTPSQRPQSKPHEELMLLLHRLL